MFDADVAFREWLLTSSAVLALAPATQIVAGDLPLSANPGAGQTWISFRARGGQRHPEIANWADISFAVTCWSRYEGDLTARGICLAISDLIYATNNLPLNEATIVCAVEEVAAQDVTDPATQWAMCVTYIKVSMRSLTG